MVRTILAVVAGFVAWSVLWLVAGQVAHAAAPAAFDPDGATPQTGVLVGLLLASFACSLCAGATLGLVSPGATGAVALSVVLLAVGIMVQSQYWSVIPLWYNLIFLAMLVPLPIVGAKLTQQRSAVPAG